MIGRADIEESKSNVAMNAWLPQASYPYGNFSDTSRFKLGRSKGSIGLAFAASTHTESRSQVGFCPFAPHEISVLIEPTLGHLCYHLTDVPPQPNSPPDDVFQSHHPLLPSKRKEERELSTRQPNNQGIHRSRRTTKLSGLRVMESVKQRSK